MEMRKIGRACFLSGLAFGCVAFLYAPLLWWLGIIAGFACGYVSYEFGKVPSMSGIYSGLRSSLHSCVRVSSAVSEDVQTWCSKPHPFTYISLFVSSLICYRWPFPVLAEGITEPGTLFVVAVVPILMLPLVLIAQIVSVPIVIIAYIGARVGEKCYWWPPLVLAITDEECEEELKRLESSGLEKKPLNYANVTRWLVKGLWAITFFFMWTLWKYLCIAILATFRFAAQFLWRQCMRVLTHRRLLCGVDGTLGGVVSYYLFEEHVTSGPEIALAILFGGVLGMSLGILHWRSVSK